MIRYRPLKIPDPQPTIIPGSRYETVVNKSNLFMYSIQQELFLSTNIEQKKYVTKALRFWFLLQKKKKKTVLNLRTNNAVTYRKVEGLSQVLT